MLTDRSKFLDRRRSSRAAISIPLIASGKNQSGESFQIAARTHTVSEFGCLLRLEAEVFLDQLINLQRPDLGKSLIGKIVSVWRHPDGNHFVGISFAESALDFWRVPFAAE
jgi:hypothetical protein